MTDQSAQRLVTALLGMREHLQSCPACAEEHATLLALVGTLH